MLARGIDLLYEARAERRAVAAFTTYTLESTRAICLAAEQTGLPVILQAGASSFKHVGMEPLAAAALAAAATATVPVGVHLDHATDPDQVLACLALGYSSVMFDGSALTLEENVAVTASLVERAHALGAWVEAELAGFSGDEDSSSDVEAGALTDVGEAADFVARTGVDVLAAAVGTVHGFTSRPVHIDFDRLAAIRDATAVPLALHGASGLPDEELRRAVETGIVKVNINAELRRAYLGAVGDAIEPGSDDVPSVQRAAIEAMTAVARTKLELLANR